jgi:hypothetical protein
MENKISPLPWSVDGCQIHSNGKYLLALQSGAPLSESKSNAIAICEAMNSTYGKGIDPSSVPELLEALKFCMSVMRAQGMYDRSEFIAYDKAQDAIDKSIIKQ